MDASRPSRGRPSADRAARIDSDILTVALELFLDKGYENTSMEAIAAHAKVSKGTLYARYSGKEPLFREILHTEMTQWSQRAGADDHLLPPDLEGRTRHHARVLMQVFGWPDFQRVSQLMDSLRVLFPDLLREWHDMGTVHYLNFLSDEMAHAAAAEGREPQDWPLIAGIVLHSLSGWYRAEAMLGDVDQGKARAYADSVVDLLMHAVPAGKVHDQSPSSARQSR